MRGAGPANGLALPRAEVADGAGGDRGHSDEPDPQRGEIAGRDGEDVSREERAGARLAAVRDEEHCEQQRTPGTIARELRMTHAPIGTVLQHDPAREVPPEYDVFCEGCGYSLAGIAADRCPECGRAYDPADLPFARVPWLHRRRIGWWRAYVKTVAMVLFTPRRFARELCRPVRVSKDDARRFRGVTLWIASRSFLFALGTIAVFDAWDAWAMRSASRNVVVVVAMLGYGVAGGMFFALATDMPLFIWKTLPALRPTELAPVHSYAAAPLALMPLLAAAVAVAAAVAHFLRFPVDDWGIFVLTVGLGGILLALWFLSIVLMRTASGAGGGRLLALALYLPAHWLLMFLTVSLGFALVMSIVVPLIRHLLR
jgi:hypothetical protein